jgi:tryptophan synthase beta chain
MGSYDKYHAGQLHDYDYPEEEIARSIANLPKL